MSAMSIKSTPIQSGGAKTGVETEAQKMDKMKQLMAE